MRFTEKPWQQLRQAKTSYKIAQGISCTCTQGADRRRAFSWFSWFLVECCRRSFPSFLILASIVSAVCPVPALHTRMPPVRSGPCKLVRRPTADQRANTLCKRIKQNFVEKGESTSSFSPTFGDRELIRYFLRGASGNLCILPTSMWHLCL